MSVKITSIYLLLIIASFIDNTESRNCFTGTQKVTEISSWYAYNSPNLSSESYEHNTHKCPSGYVRDSAYSHLTTEYYKGQTIFKIMSYAVCCEGGALYTMGVLLS